jgi:hypothetical protein
MGREIACPALSLAIVLRDNFLQTRYDFSEKSAASARFNG